MTDGCTAATADAINRSISHNEIVTVRWTETLAIELFAECDGDVYDAGRERHEYWGTNLDGEKWRVHLSGSPR